MSTKPTEELKLISVATVVERERCCAILCGMCDNPQDTVGVAYCHEKENRWVHDNLVPYNKGVFHHCQASKIRGEL